MLDAVSRARPEQRVHRPEEGQGAQDGERFEPLKLRSNLVEEMRRKPAMEEWRSESSQEDLFLNLARADDPLHAAMDLSPEDRHRVCIHPEISSKYNFLSNLILFVLHPNASLPTLWAHDCMERRQNTGANIS